MGRQKTLAEPGSGTGPVVILAGGAPSLSRQPRLVPAAICTLRPPATARRTGDCRAWSPVAPRKQAQSEVVGDAVARYASAAGTGPVVPRHCTASRSLPGMRAAILAARLIITSSFRRPAITTERADRLLALSGRERKRGP
jgi:hypothetical protein